MSNDLIPQVGGKLANADSFKEVVSSGDYLSRFQLFGSKTDAVAEGRIAVAHYGLVKDDDIIDLGPEVDVIIVTWRPKAVQTGNDFVISYDTQSEVFQKIKAMSSVRDSGAMYGPEFLLWIPDAGVFTAFHMNSKTSRREAKKVAPLIGKACTFKARLITTPKYKWHGPVAIPCSADLTPPAEDALRAEADKFLNPPEPEIEVAPDDERAQ